MDFYFGLVLGLLTVGLGGCIMLSIIFSIKRKSKRRVDSLLPTDYLLREEVSVLLGSKNQEAKNGKKNFGSINRAKDILTSMEAFEMRNRFYKDGKFSFLNE